VDPKELASSLNFLLGFMDWVWRQDLAGSRQAYKIFKVFADRITKLERDFTHSKHAALLQTSLILGAYEVGLTDEAYQVLGLDHLDLGRSIMLNPRALISVIGLVARWARAASDSYRSRTEHVPRIELLIGVALPQLFQEQFGKRFGAGTAGDSRANGPGIPFEQACLAAASITRLDGKPYSEETIRTYWQKQQKGSGKRRRAPEKMQKNN
jgi:hypothetical protein